jgi:hypothetical protein
MAEVIRRTDNADGTVTLIVSDSPMPDEIRKMLPGLGIDPASEIRSNNKIVQFPSKVAGKDPITQKTGLTEVTITPPKLK